ncbi:hypothetical protein EV586_105252 [Tumebacillus sp. BK434]|uniref:hypothetical protein n=1 Tax=Tumebacillus sp. BK434 TaxID=2512169 RepID=UPI0010486BBB|nr:hypothetical protein [Tumebacillus sp. BK434]TCP53906.1 hypothetical protein EV586_105252 [Tumebacillus sp. BK434]
MRKHNFLQTIQALIRMHQAGLLGGETMPEDALLGVVPEQELPDVLTLAMALNYQRNSYSLWEAVANAYRDEQTRWVFTPHKAMKSGRAQLAEALLHHRVALQPNRHPEIWQRVAAGIANSSSLGDVTGLIESADSDLAVLKQIMQGTRKAEFPYLSGPKIFNYWLYVLETYAGVSWKYRELITIAPDTHILQATAKLGICASVDRQEVAEAWEAALQGSGIAPIDVHTPLWLWSRAGFPAIEEL